ncbi:MAG TPA: polysaccharide biosynthesis/export family protein, partial [Cellvibrionaceae bacterium]|nr:polysaccharide biosynthesis/export family protein [Cellvibrionaceae bacterium]
MKCFKYGLLILLMKTGSCLAAQQLMPSPAQIEQFKSLSAEEKQALARSVGIDPASMSTNSAQPQIREPETPQRTAGDKKQSPDASKSKEAKVKNIGDKDTNLKSAESLEDESLNENPAVDVKKPAKDQTVTLKPFGADLFSNGPSSFTPASDIPVPADYVMGPGDNIVIQLYGKENNAYSLTINREGQVQFPEIGPVNLAGLSFSQAQTVLNEVVEKQMIGVKSSVTMGALRSIRIFVLGEVMQPGSFTVGALSTMTNALFASGGINKVGSFRNIQLKRQGKVVTTLDLYDLLLRGDTSGDARLMPGDVLFVPPVGETITVMGAVTRPAIYELQNSADVAGALGLAGGASTNAYLPESRLERI